jgi:hypothetical protein
MSVSFGYYDLIETFPKSGCAVCNLLIRNVSRLLESILYEYVVDRGTQATFRASRGLCSEHSWQMVVMGNALGIATLHEVVLDEVMTIIQRETANGTAQKGRGWLRFAEAPYSALAASLEPAKPCLVCTMMNTREAEYVSVLGEHVHDERMRASFRGSEGLCLEHFRQILRHTRDADNARTIVAIQLDIWERLQHELNEFMRKQNAEYADEKIGAEATSWQRVVARLAGEKSVFTARRG